jgi:hypothetical protein
MRNTITPPYSTVPGFVTGDSGIVTAIPVEPGKSVTFSRNPRSRSIGIVGHDAPE